MRHGGASLGQCVIWWASKHARPLLPQRLQVSCLDLFTMRGPPDPKVPIEETMKAVKVSGAAENLTLLGMSKLMRACM